MKIGSFTFAAMMSGVFISLCFNHAFAASNYNVDKDKSEVKFLAVGKPGFLKIKGEGATVEGSLTVDNNTIKGHLTATLTGLKTGIDLRDEHMHTKYLDTVKFPTSTVKFNSVDLKGEQTGSCTFKGFLVIKGTEKPIEGSCEFEGIGSDSLKFIAHAEIKLADFPVGVPSHLGITVAEKVTISAALVAKKDLALKN